MQDMERKQEEAKKIALWEDPKTIKFDELDKILHKWLEIVDWGLNKATLSFIVANRLPGNSVWTLLVGGPGSGKTEYISGLNYLPFIFTMSSLTPQTLISGQKGVEGLLWKLNDKIFCFKDFTTILEMNSDARSEILSQFREMYDGYYEKSYGTGDIKRWNGKVGFFAGVTSIIDIREQSYSSLGERFIKYRIIPPDGMTMARKALENTTRTVIMQEEIKMGFMQCIKGVLNGLGTAEELILTDVQKEKLIRLANFATLARSAVTRDFGMTKEVIYKPTREMPTRFTQQLSQIAIALKLINRANVGKDELLELDEKILFKIALDSIPQMRRQMLQKLAEHVTITTEVMANSTAYPTTTTRRYLEDLFVLGICTRERGEGNSHTWELKDEFRAIMEEYDGVKIIADEERMIEEAEAARVMDVFTEEEKAMNKLQAKAEEEGML